MAEGDRSTWSNILGAVKEAGARLVDKLYGYIARRNVEELIRETRRIPTSERDKKEWLAAYFQSDAGRNITREERHQAYNDLLGVDRNKRHRG